MVEARLHSLPVVHRTGTARDLVGIVSQGDLLRGVQAALVEPMYAAEIAEGVRS
jgi:CBS-domain-containing membrane protein